MLLADAVALEITPGSVMAGASVIGAAIVLGFVLAAWMIRSALTQSSEAIAENSELVRKTNTLIQILAARQDVRLHSEE